MRTIKTIIFSLLFFTVFSLSAQEKEKSQLNMSIGKIITDNLLKKFKDSTAVYTFCLKIKLIKKSGGLTEVSTTINNPEVNKIFEASDLLKHVNYLDFLKFHKKNSTLLFRFYLITLSSKNVPQTLEVYNIPEVTKYIITDNEPGLIEMGVFTQTIDQTVYN